MADLLAPFVGDRASGLAGLLIEQFGGLNAALTPDPRTLADPELAEACRLLQSARKLVEGAAREQLQGSAVRASDRSMLEYLRLAIGGARRECFLAVYLDRRSRYLRDEVVGRGSCRQPRLSTRAVFQRALDLGANGLLLAHDHPSGRCSPSSPDLVTTDHLRTLANWLDIVLVDHLIVTPTQVFSIQVGRLL